MTVAFCALAGFRAQADDIPFPAAAAQVEQAASMEDTSAAKEAYIIDAETGAVLLAKNENEQMPTSSMSKTLTMYLTFEALKDGRLTLGTELPVSEKAWRMGGSKMFVEVNKKVKVEDLIQGVVVQSGNDATVVLAEGIAGTEESFADMLNAKAQQLGLEHSHFMNASGWPVDGHYSTAHDLTMIGLHLIRDFPDYYHYFGETEYTYNNIRQPNRNPLLYRNIGADGIKTGHTEIAGYGLMASGERNGRRVVMTLNGMDSMETRANEGARLLDWALRSFENDTLFKAGMPVENAEVVMGQKVDVPLVTAGDVRLTVPIAFKNDLKAEVVYKGPLVAPVAKGQDVGTLRVTVPRVGVYEYKLVAGEDVPSLGLFAATVTKLRMMAAGNKAEDKE
jgi:D-alanyl-D-alanine carboxypeptidase (penicillin-binding protein 5/6)